VLDTQLVTGQLRALGYRFTDDWQAADVVLYNTCSVREHAEATRNYETYNRLANQARELSVPVLNQNRFLALVGYYRR